VQRYEKTSEEQNKLVYFFFRVAVSSRLCRKVTKKVEKNNGFWRINANRSKIKEKLYYSLALYPNLGKASPESGARDSALRKSSPKESYKILKITPTF